MKTGAPGVNRTPNLLVRSQPLYPIELQARRKNLISARMQTLFDFYSLEGNLRFPSNVPPSAGLFSFL